MLKTRLVSSLEKCFCEDKIDQFSPLSNISMLRNEHLSFQLLHTATDLSDPFRTLCKLTLSGDLAPYATARTVEQVSVIMPIDPDHTDDNYLRHTPGLYPDLLRPLHYGGSVSVVRNLLSSVWVEIVPERELAAGEHKLIVTLTSPEGEAVAVETLLVEVIDASLPEQDLIFTQWLHCDCLADYYDCEVWSEKHWEIVERFAAAAARRGVNLLLTPIHTPPLDTAVGGERRTTQLVEVYLEQGSYRFDFSKLDRWIDMCDRIGIRYLEFAHFFTQWGAYHAPKIMAHVDGEYRRIFGWDTDATGNDYVAYLNAYIPALLSHLRERKDDRRSFFHISDEPNQAQLESYRRAKAVVAPMLKGYTIMDALSDFECWSTGLVETPIPSSDHIEPFLDAQVSGLWTYYCCCQTKDVSNRLIAMPLHRTRCIGMQLYKYDIAGFLHWGLNHYNNRFSVDRINPFSDMSGEFWVPGGDTHSLYPGENGEPWESMRIISFHEALQDLRAMKLAEARCGKDAVVGAMEEIFGTIRFDRCTRDCATMLAIRERINRMIRDGK